MMTSTSGSRWPESFQEFDAEMPACDVENGDVDLVLAGEFDGALAVVGEDQIVILLEDDAQGLPRALLVIDDEEGGFFPRGLRTWESG